MKSRSLIPRTGMSSPYLRATRTGTYGFLAALPLILFYELLIRVANTSEAMQIRVGADVWIKSFLSMIGATGTWMLSAVLIGIGLIVVFLERKQHIPLKTRYFGLLVAESSVYAVLVAFLVSGVVGMLFAGIALVPAAASPMPEQGLLLRIALSIGAGVYEELVFRVLLVGGLYLLFSLVSPGSALSYVVAALIGAAVFSAVHYMGALGDPFTLSSFTFRFLFGLALNGLFLWRGFGVAAWTHALYDILIVTHLLG